MGYTIFNTRFKYHLKKLNNTAAAYFAHTDADHIFAMSFIRIKLLNHFQYIVSINIGLLN